MTHFGAIILSMVATSLSAADYAWIKARDDYGWGHTAYVLNLLTFDGRLWAFEGNVIHSSPNGRDWRIESRRPGWRGEVAHGNALAFNGSLWALGGHYEEGRRVRNDVWSSEDGKKWQQVTASAGWSPRRGHANVVFRGKMWVLGGEGLNDVWSSPDGMQWTRAAEHAAWPARNRHRLLVLKDRLWLIGGLAGDRQLCDVWSSVDGATWVQITGCAEWGPRFVPSAAVYDGKLWVIGGFQKNDAWSSEDGHRWRRATENAGWLPRAGANLAELNGRLWLVGGKTGISSNSNPQDIWYMTAATAAARDGPFRAGAAPTQTAR